MYTHSLSLVVVAYCYQCIYL